MAGSSGGRQAITAGSTAAASGVRQTVYGVPGSGY